MGQKPKSRTPLEQVKELLCLPKLDANFDSKSMRSALEALVCEVETLRARNEDLRESMAQLQEARDRYHRLYEAAPLAHLLVDAYGIIHDANEAAAQLLGVEKRRLAGELLSEYVVAEDIRRFQECWEQGHCGCEGGQCDVRVKHREGMLVHVQISRQGRNDTMSQREPSLITLTNISTLKRNERKLRREQEELAARNEQIREELGSVRRILTMTAQQYRMVVERANVGICIVQDGRVCFANRMAAELVGQTPEELTGKEYGPLVHAEDLSEETRMLEGVSRHDSRDVRIYGRDGGVRWVRASSSLIEWEGRAGILVVANDITERKELEGRLREERRMLVTLLDSIPVIVTVFDEQARVLYMNPAYEKVLGWTLDDFAKGNALELLLPDEEERRKGFEFMMTRPDRWHEFNTRSKGGEVVPTSWKNVYMDDGKLIGIGIDLRDRREAEAEMRRTLEMLERKATALMEVMAQVERRSQLVKENIVTNIEKVILPTLRRLEKRAKQKGIHFEVRGMERELEDIASPLVSRLQASFGELTKREQEVARLLAKGLSTNEAAQELGLSGPTVQKYRELIRKKLKLRGRKMNLAAYLQSISAKQLVEKD